MIKITTLFISFFCFPILQCAAQNVGIGVDTPLSKLHVGGQLRADSILVNGLQNASQLLSVRNFKSGLDQSLTTGNAVLSSAITPRWQSFTAGLSGQLSQVDFYWNNVFITAQVFRIYRGEGVNGDLLFEANINTRQTSFGGDPFTYVPITGVTLASGNKYTIWISDGSKWAGTFGNIYQAGTNGDPNSIYAGYDHAFRTYMAGTVSALQVNNAGQVGIGIESPTEKLDVAGNAKVSGTLTTGVLNTGSLSTNSFTASTLNFTNLATQSLTANGYVKIGSLVLQWGTVDYSSNVDVTVNFPVAFANAFSVTATVEQRSPAGSGANVPCKISAITPTNFVVAGTQVFSGDATSKVKWMAIGN
jgi:hypothetical protein